VHGVDRAAGGVGGDGGEERRVEDAEAHFLALHIAVSRGDAEMLVDRVAGRLGPPRDEHAGEKQHKTWRSTRPSRAAGFSPCVRDTRSARSGSRRSRGSGGNSRVASDFQGVRGVGVGVAAAVGAEHLDLDLPRPSAPGRSSAYPRPGPP